MACAVLHLDHQLECLGHSNRYGQTEKKSCMLITLDNDIDRQGVMRSKRPALIQDLGLRVVNVRITKAAPKLGQYLRGNMVKYFVKCKASCNH